MSNPEGKTPTTDFTETNKDCVTVKLDGYSKESMALLSYFRENHGTSIKVKKENGENGFRMKISGGKLVVENSHGDQTEAVDGTYLIPSQTWQEILENKKNVGAKFSK